jgi:hypothetical protein
MSNYLYFYLEENSYKVILSDINLIIMINYCFNEFWERFVKIFLKRRVISITIDDFKWLQEEGR